MDFTSLYNLRGKETKLVDIAFYVAAFLLIVAIFCYCIFAIKIYFQNQKIAGVNAQIAMYGTKEQKATEQQVADYKKKVDDFATLLNNHKLTSNVFAFIEQHTQPNVWFSNFDMSTSINEIRLSGEAESMDDLSRQSQALENEKDYVRNIGVLNSQIGLNGKISFVLDMFVNTKIFSYQNAAALQAPAAAQINP